MELLFSFEHPLLRLGGILTHTPDELLPLESCDLATSSSL